MKSISSHLYRTFAVDWIIIILLKRHHTVRLAYWQSLYALFPTSLPHLCCCHAPVMLGQEASDGSMTLLSWHLPSILPPSLYLPLSWWAPLNDLSVSPYRLWDLGGQREGFFLYLILSEDMRREKGVVDNKGLVGTAAMAGAPSPSQSVSSHAVPFPAPGQPALDSYKLMWALWLLTKVISWEPVSLFKKMCME